MSRIRKKHAEPYIRIANPHPGGAAYTQLSKATDYVLTGLAVFAGETCIRFLDQDERRLNMLAERHRQAAAQERHATSGLGYEWHGAQSGGYQVMQADPGHVVATPLRQSVKPAGVRCRVISQHGITCLWPDRQSDAAPAT